MRLSSSGLRRRRRSRSLHPARQQGLASSSDILPGARVSSLEDGLELFVRGRGVELAEEFFVRPESRADVLARAEAGVAGVRTERLDGLLLLAARSGGIVPVDDLHIEIQSPEAEVATWKRRRCAPGNKSCDVPSLAASPNAYDRFARTRRPSSRRSIPIFLRTSSITTSRQSRLPRRNARDARRAEVRRSSGGTSRQGLVARRDTALLYA